MVNLPRRAGTDCGQQDRDLLDGCGRGDVQSWQGILDRYERLVFSIPLNFGLSRDDAADVVQSTFLALLQGIDSIREHERLGSWLATVARRHTWRLAERSRRDLVVPVPDVGSEPDLDGIDTWDRLEWLHGALLTLEPRCRELIVALYLDRGEPSYAEVAARIGRPVGSIGPTRARCLERLRSALVAADL